MVLSHNRAEHAEERKGERIRDYFAIHAPKSEYPHLAKRAINALERGEIRTMDALARATEEEIAEKRNVGEKGLALILLLRGRYAAERDIELA